MSGFPFSNTPLNAPLEETVVIVGVGLIGGSLAAAIRQRGVARRVIGVGRNASRLESARQAKLIDDVSTDLVEAARSASLIVFCTPVDKIVEQVRQVVTGLNSSEKRATHSGTSKRKPGAEKLLLTDAGSVKGAICHPLADVTNFIGSHPIAGSHRQGFEAADPNLYQGKVCVLTPLDSADRNHLIRLEKFWSAVGMKTVSMSPEEHDAALAMTSHLPHVVASALAATLTPDKVPFVGSGFRTTTRIAAGDPDLWTQILLNNVNDIVSGIEDVQHRLESFHLALKLGNTEVLKQLLEEGKEARERVEKE
ncbi:MAG: prephenate dehydrogenase/arogenate dehydrogenase family protein [Planctomycetes bacterium]|nr:prephenate dehydrogenase/arogenate dehydrogenase family protein [Planctomycetota bacterium]